MINAYSSIISYQEDEWEDYLNKLALIDIFQPVINKYKNKNTLKCVIRYIVWAYSVDSEMVVLGDDWKSNKMRIWDAAQVEPIKNLYEEVVLLKSKDVIATIENWLTWQDVDVFKQLSLLKDLRVQMQLASLSDIIKSTGEVDYDAKFKCAGYSIELKKMIKDLESELIQNNVRLKEAVKDIKTASKIRQTVSPENFSR